MSTNPPAATAPNAAFPKPGTSRETTVTSRLIEVAIWGWRVAAVGFAVWVVAAAGVLYVEYGRAEDTFGILALYLCGALVLGLAVWATRYILTGERRSYLATLKQASFGNMALYFWFVPAVLVIGAFATALWHGASHADLRLQHMSEGVGAALFILLLGAPGWFFAPKAHSHVGHMVGTAVAGVLVLTVNLVLI